eukprot:4837889-Pleurochrysis_carterae.AAC.3
MPTPVLLPRTGLQSRAVAVGTPDEAAGSAPVVMANATSVPQLHSVARSLCAAHATASTQALRSGALEPLPLPRPLCTQLRPLACFPLALRGLQTGEFSPPRAKNNTTNKAGEKPADSSVASQALHGTHTSLSL